MSVALKVAGIEEPFWVMRSHSRSSDTFAVQPLEGPTPTLEYVQGHAFRYCEWAGVDGLAAGFYTDETAWDAAHVYADEGYEGRSHFEAAFTGCLAGLMASDS